MTIHLKCKPNCLLMLLSCVVVVSVKSDHQPFSVPTPGHPHTPLQSYSVRTPGGPTTPSMVSRTPGAPHTPGAAHTPLGGVHPATPRRPVTSAPAQRLPSPMPNEEMLLRSKKHFCYARHFPITQDEVGQHEANQVSLMTSHSLSCTCAVEFEVCDVTDVVVFAANGVVVRIRS